MKNILKIFIILTIFVSCSKKAAEETHYYYGEVKTTSPDGQIPYGPSKYSLVKRTINQEQKSISELVSQDGNTYNTILSQTDEISVFSAKDEKNSFNGTLKFSGEDWKWNTWTYDITMTDNSGKVIGDGSLTPTGIETKKKFVSPDGKEQVLITENLKEITAEEYAKLSSK